MYFDVYFEKGDKILDDKYSKFFWYSEVLETSDVLTSYDENDKLVVVVLLAEMYDKPKIYKSLFKKKYCKIFEIKRDKFSDNSVTQYACNNEIMLNKLKIKKIRNALPKKYGMHYQKNTE